jgi:hypothetical protein
MVKANIDLIKVNIHTKLLESKSYINRVSIKIRHRLKISEQDLKFSEKPYIGCFKLKASIISFRPRSFVRNSFGSVAPLFTGMARYSLIDILIEIFFLASV